MSYAKDCVAFVADITPTTSKPAAIWRKTAAPDAPGFIGHANLNDPLVPI
jgi:hypothetical protein